MDNIQLYYIDNEINKIDKMKQGDVMSWCPVNGTGSSRRRKLLKRN